MQSFADQCLDMARSLLGHNLGAVKEDGSINSVAGEESRPDEPGHAAFAIGEYYRATNETVLDSFDLVDLSARSITAQAFMEPEDPNGLGCAALGLLAFSPAKDRNAVWERLLDPTRQRLDKMLLSRSDYTNHIQAFNVAKSVARFSMGLSKKDETGKLIDRFLSRIKEHSTAGYQDDAPDGAPGGAFDIYGVLSFIFIRQALQLHANIHLRDRKLPSLRTYAEKYIRMLPDIVRQDGMGWIYGRSIGAYGQMHCISIILQALRDGWIQEERKPQYCDLLRRLFQFFFVTFLDQEHGYLVIRDGERTAAASHTTRRANFDGARYLCQWSRLARSIGGAMTPKAPPSKTGGRFVIFDKSVRKEQGLFIYHDNSSGLHVQLPLVSPAGQGSSHSLAFPHCPGIFDFPVSGFLPIMLPELTFGKDAVVPAYYGKRCVTGMGLRKTFYFRYEQPEFITADGALLRGLGAVKVAWTFAGNKVTGDFIFTVKNQIQLDRMRYVLAIAAPHSSYSFATSFRLGEGGLRCSVHRDDFQAVWQETEAVTHEPNYRTYYGNIHYLQTLLRDHPLNMRPNHQYRLTVSFEPDIAFTGE